VISVIASRESGLFSSGFEEIPDNLQEASTNFFYGVQEGG